MNFHYLLLFRCTVTQLNKNGINYKRIIINYKEIHIIVLVIAIINKNGWLVYILVYILVIAIINKNGWLVTEMRNGKIKN